MLQIQAVQRAAILQLHSRHEINDDVMRKLEREVDMIQLRYSPSDD